MLSRSQINLFLFEDADGLVLVDSGYPGSAGFFHSELERIGRDIRDIHHILVTHLHPDHTGALADLKELSGAYAAMHPVDAALVRLGIFARPSTPAPGLLAALLVKLFIRGGSSYPPVAVEDTIEDGQLLPYAGGLRVIHAPGHSAGQVALLWEPRKLLLCADACANAFGLDYSPIYEDFELGKHTLRRLAALDFNAAVFSHGKPILHGASQAFRRRFA